MFRHSWLVGSLSHSEGFRPGAIARTAIKKHPKIYCFETQPDGDGGAANDRLEYGNVRAEEPAGFGLNGVGWGFLGVGRAAHVGISGLAGPNDLGGRPVGYDEVRDVPEHKGSCTHDAVLANTNRVDDIDAKHHRREGLNRDPTSCRYGWREARKIPHSPVMIEGGLCIYYAELADNGVGAHDSAGEDNRASPYACAVSNLSGWMNRSQKGEIGHDGANPLHEPMTNPVIADGDNCPADFILPDEFGQPRFAAQDCVSKASVADGFKGVDDAGYAIFTFPFDGFNHSVRVTGRTNHRDVVHVAGPRQDCYALSGC